MESFAHAGAVMNRFENKVNPAKAAMKKMRLKIRLILPELSDEVRVMLRRVALAKRAIFS